MVCVVETSAAELFERVMSEEDAPSLDNGSGTPDPPADADDGDDDGFDERVEWAFYGFVLGALYVYVLWIVSEWVKK
jgi:hypothetical protein